MNNYCYIGVDPAFRKDGFCVCVIDEENMVDFKMISFLEFIDWTGDAPIVANSFVNVENSNLQDKTFDMRGNKQLVARKSRNVGANQAISQCTFDVCKKVWGDHAFQVSPKEKGQKWTNSVFLAVVKQNNHQLLNYKGNKTEQDKRDAYKLALQAKAKAKYLLMSKNKKK